MRLGNARRQHAKFKRRRRREEEGRQRGGAVFVNANKAARPGRLPPSLCGCAITIHRDRVRAPGAGGRERTIKQEWWKTTGRPRKGRGACGAQRQGGCRQGNGSAPRARARAKQAKEAQSLADEGPGTREAREREQRKGRAGGRRGARSSAPDDRGFQGNGTKSARGKGGGARCGACLAGARGDRRRKWRRENWGRRDAKKQRRERCGIDALACGGNRRVVVNGNNLTSTGKRQTGKGVKTCVATM